MLVVEVGTQLSQNFLQRVGVQPVVGVNDLEIDARRVADALVDALAVAAVLLMDDANDGGVFFGYSQSVPSGHTDTYYNNV